MNPRDCFWRRPVVAALLCLAACSAGVSRGADVSGYEPKPADPYFAKFNPRRAPAPGPLLLTRGDRLIIAGDSITEQKLYSRIIETYLTVCRPDLAIEVRQLGWGGETVEGFRRRVESDCLRFHPSVVTLCYGMNDSKYRPYDDLNGQWFRDNLTALVQQLEGANARVLVGSPGIAERLAGWVRGRAGTLDEHNLNLCTLRDIALDVAEHEHARFADVFWPMYQAAFTARARYGGDPDHPYALIGRDGIHPDWAGHLIMAYAFLRGLGLDGDLGTIVVDTEAKTATATDGHEIKAFDGRTISVVSTRYPFCAVGPLDREDSIRSGMSFVPFDAELNRLTLVVKGPAKRFYSVRWGEQTRQFSAEHLARGVNLAAEFEVNPFNAAFARVDAAVAAKQAFETREVRERMHGAQPPTALDAIVQQSEAERAELVAHIQAARVPVTHTIELSWW